MWHVLCWVAGSTGRSRTGPGSGDELSALDWNDAWTLLNPRGCSVRGEASA
jgi:hypothetical protein